VAAEFASRLALIAFFVVCLRGLIAQSDFFAVARSGLLTATAAFVVGWLLGYLADLLTRELAQSDVARLLERREATQQG